MHMTHELPSLFSLTGFAGLALLLAGIGAAVLIPVMSNVSWSKLTRRRVAAVAVAGLAFQVFHLFEHLIQLGYWFLHPTSAPYMTPWALDGVDGLGVWFDQLPGNVAPAAGGMEGLHLVGNVIFLMGIVALRHVTPKPLPGVKTAFVVQGLHVAEHVLLTATLVLFGTPIGVSTLFGAAYDFGFGGTLRVWFHFMINVGATMPAVWALWNWHDQRSSSVIEAAGSDTIIDLRPHAQLVDQG